MLTGSHLHTDITATHRQRGSAQTAAGHECLFAYCLQDCLCLKVSDRAIASPCYSRPRVAFLFRYSPHLEMLLLTCTRLWPAACQLNCSQSDPCADAPGPFLHPQIQLFHDATDAVGRCCPVSGLGFPPGEISHMSGERCAVFDLKPFYVAGKPQIDAGTSLLPFCFQELG